MPTKRKNRQGKPISAPEKPQKKKDDQVVKVKKQGLFSFKAANGKWYRLTPKQKHWCDIYLEEGANQTIASLEAYKVTNKHLCKIPWKLLSDKEKRKRIAAENTASHIGTQNFRKLPIKNYIDKVLADAGYTDKRVKLKHFENMMQNKSISASNQAIDMYYKAGGKYKDEDRGYKEEIEAFFRGVKSLVKK